MEKTTDIKDLNECNRLRNAIDSTTLDMDNAEKEVLHNTMLKLDKRELYSLYAYLKVQTSNAYDEGYKDAREEWESVE